MREGQIKDQGHALDMMLGLAMEVCTYYLQAIERLAIIEDDPQWRSDNANPRCQQSLLAYTPDKLPVRSST